jgi:protein-S-isoprenylcysteine O-methyltransferase Ste14
MQQIARRIRVPMGFVVAAVFLVFARPSLLTLLWSLALVLPGLWLRGYSAGYIRKNAEVTTSGPYAYTRNPLYLGSLLITLGFGMAAGRWWLCGLLAGLFAAIYIPTILGEEAYLREHFAGFEAYAARVPRLLPRLTAAATRDGAGAFSPQRYRKHREYNALMGAGAVYLALGLRLWWQRTH